MRNTAPLLLTLVMSIAAAQKNPTTGYAPVNGINLYYEIHGPGKPEFGNSGEPVVLLHGAFMTITNNWDGWIGELAKTQKVIAVEMQRHGRTADIARDMTSENLADDVASATKFSHTGLTPGVEVSYRIRACRGPLVNEPSNEAAVVAHRYKTCGIRRRQ